MPWCYICAAYLVLETSSQGCSPGNVKLFTNTRPIFTKTYTENMVLTFQLQIVLSQLLTII